jgi:hypothetical protein
MMNNPVYREIPSPATHGFGTVSSLGALMGILANGGLHLPTSNKLLEPETIAKMSQPLVAGLDFVLLNNQSFGRGVSIKENPLVSLKHHHNFSRAKRAHLTDFISASFQPSKLLIFA